MKRSIILKISIIFFISIVLATLLICFFIFEKNKSEYSVETHTISETYNGQEFLIEERQITKFNFPVTLYKKRQIIVYKKDQLFTPVAGFYEDFVPADSDNCFGDYTLQALLEKYPVESTDNLVESYDIETYHIEMYQVFEESKYDDSGYKEITFLIYDNQKMISKVVVDKSEFEQISKIKKIYDDGQVLGLEINDKYITFFNVISNEYAQIELSEYYYDENNMPMKSDDWKDHWVNSNNKFFYNH